MSRRKRRCMDFIYGFRNWENVVISNYNLCGRGHHLYMTLSQISQFIYLEMRNLLPSGEKSAVATCDLAM